MKFPKKNALKVLKKIVKTDIDENWEIDLHNKNLIPPDYSVFSGIDTNEYREILDIFTRMRYKKVTPIPCTKADMKLLKSIVKTDKPRVFMLQSADNYQVVRLISNTFVEFLKFLSLSNSNQGIVSGLEQEYVQIQKDMYWKIFDSETIQKVNIVAGVDLAYYVKNCIEYAVCVIARIKMLNQFLYQLERELTLILQLK